MISGQALSGMSLFPEAMASGPSGGDMVYAGLGASQQVAAKHQRQGEIAELGLGNREELQGDNAYPDERPGDVRRY